MATYTSNYNLYMPDPTDPVGDFRSEFNSNMQTIDQNLGGGGGGGGNVYGTFIDTNRVIASGNYSSSYSYTATEDCYLFFTCGGTTSSSGKLYLDGNLIRYIFVNTSDNNYGDGIYLKKGQTAEVQSPQAGTFQYIVYGLTQGTESIFTPIIYSDTERCIGIWRDNKPLYQKSFPISATAIMANTWHSISTVDVANVETIVRTELHLGGGEESNNSWGFGRNDNGVFKVFSPVQLLVNIITIQYTKTTDVAGSGNWNTDGVPTHHYSTNEQVIGTWTNGKPLYRQVITFNTGVVPSNIGVNITNYMPVNCVVVDTSFFIEYSYEGIDYRNVNVNGGYTAESTTHYFYFSIGSAQYDKHVELTIEYIKTTD